MRWVYEFEERALREFKRLDRQAQKEIVAYLDERVAGTENPRRFGKALRGSMAGIWRDRVGNYRIICQIRNEQLFVAVIRVGHRKDVYE